MRRDNLIYAQVGAEAAPPYSTFTCLLLLSGKEVGAAESARPLRAAAAAGMIRARPQRAAKSMVLRARRIDGFAVRCSRCCNAHCSKDEARLDEARAALSARIRRMARWRERRRS